MKSGRPNEPSNKAKLRMEAFKAARGMAGKGKVTDPKPTLPKVKDILPQKPAESKEDHLSKAKGVAAREGELSAQKPVVSKKETLPKKKGVRANAKDVAPKKATLRKMKNISKAKGSTPKIEKVSKAKQAATIKPDRSKRTGKSS